MADLLKNPGHRTIRQRMGRLAFWFLMSYLGLAIFSVSFYQRGQGMYQGALSRISSLTHFFMELQETQAYLDAAIKREGARDMEDFLSALHDLRMYYESMEKDAMGKSYHGEVILLGSLFFQYEQGGERIVSSLRQSSSLPLSSPSSLASSSKPSFADASASSLPWLSLASLPTAASSVASSSFSSYPLSSTERLSSLLPLYQDMEVLAECMDREFRSLHVSLLGEEEALARRNGIRQKGAGYVFFSLLAIITLLCLFVSFKLMASISEPMQELCRYARLIGDGNVRGRPSPLIMRGDAPEEAFVMAGAFNQMMEALLEHIETLKENARAKELLQETELSLRISELKLLQAQVNPHFLFNTLNMISKSVYLGHKDTATSLLQATARHLRYSLDYSDRSATLQQELESLGDYISIQEERFGERLFFDFILEERFHQVLIPSMILQPLVENAILYGTRESGELLEILIITRYEREKGLLIEIADNGKGMDEERLSKVREDMASDRWQRDRIGLANVSWRLRLYFQGRSQMTIDSHLGEGTQVRIVIPVEEEPCFVLDPAGERLQNRHPDQISPVKTSFLEEGSVGEKEREEQEVQKLLETKEVEKQEVEKKETAKKKEDIMEEARKGEEGHVSVTDCG